MPISRRRLAVTVATATAAGLALLGAAANTVVAIVYRDIDAVWLAIALAVLGAVLVLVCSVIWLVTRLEACHDETRKQNATASDRLVQRISDKVTLELYVALGNTIRDQLDAAARLGDATTRFRELTGDDAPINLQQWKANAATDPGSGRRRGVPADSSAS